MKPGTWIRKRQRKPLVSEMVTASIQIIQVTALRIQAVLSQHQGCAPSVPGCGVKINSEPLCNLTCHNGVRCWPAQVSAICVSHQSLPAIWLFSGRVYGMPDCMCSSRCCRKVCTTELRVDVYQRLLALCLSSR